MSIYEWALIILAIMALLHRPKVPQLRPGTLIPRPNPIDYVAVHKAWADHWTESQRQLHEGRDRREAYETQCERERLAKFRRDNAHLYT